MFWASKIPKAFKNLLDSLCCIWLFDNHLSMYGNLFFCQLGFMYPMFFVDKCVKVADGCVVSSHWATC